MPRVKVNRLRFLYRRAGSGPDVIMLPGIARAPFSRPLFDLLRPEFRTMVYGRRGKAAATRTSADLADDLRGLHQKLRLGPAYLVAHRKMALVALHAAVLYPDIVAGLVLIEPCLPGADNGAPPNTRSGLTMRRFVLIDYPVAVLTTAKSSGLPLCRFLQTNLRRCTTEIIGEDVIHWAETVRCHLRDMASRDSTRAAAAAADWRPGPHVIRSPQAEDGHIVSRWIASLSAWSV